ncbi:hypothetical protein TeGR_g5044, partial [Tetraparma gracilis]
MSKAVVYMGADPTRFDEDDNPLGEWEGDKEVTDVNIADGVTEINRYAFYKCKGLTNLSFLKGSGVTTIGTAAFADSGIASLQGAEGVRKIGNSAFGKCQDLRSIEGLGCEEMGYDCFAYCTLLQSLKGWPASMTMIPVCCFNGCTGMTAVDCDLSHVTSIEINAFYGCTSLLPPSLSKNGASPAAVLAYLKRKSKHEREDSLEALSIPPNSTYPDSSVLPSSFLRSSVCLDDFTEADQFKFEGAIDMMDMIAVAVGVGDDEWQKDECKDYLKRAALLATTPYCSPSSCAPLGFCDSDCHAGREFCGRLADYDGVLEQVLPGGGFHAVVGGMVGADVLPCAVELLQLVSGGGDDSKICNSSSSAFSNMAFGSTPYVDCLPLSVDDPNTFLRGAPPPPGSCALSTWDEHNAAEVAAVEAHNAELLLNATLAVDAPLPTFPWWRGALLPALPIVQAVLIFIGRVLAKGTKQKDNMAAVTPVLGGIQKSSSRVFARDLRFRDFFGISGIFVATALLAQVVLAVILGFHAEAAKISKVQVVCLHCIAVYAAFHLFNSAVYWRTLVEGLFDVQEGNVDPLEALNKIPPAKRLMKWYYDNFAVHTGGRYSLLLVIGAEVFEIVVQFTNANSMAGYLDWPALSFYGTLVSTNCIMFGICMLSDERFVSPPVVITVDVVMDATYVMFNVFYISPTSYWAIIVPLLLSVDMLNDSMTLHAHESVKHALFKQSTRKKNDESKANGTFEHDVIVDFAKRLNAGAENNRKEKNLQVFSKTRRVSHVVFAASALKNVLSRRESVAETVWKKLKLDNGTDMFLSVTQPCEHPEAPPATGFVRSEVYYGIKYEGTADGTKVTVLTALDPGGLLPTAIVNFGIEDGMKKKLQLYKTYFIDKKALDGSDNGGVWPDDENLYTFEFEGVGEKSKAVRRGSAEIRDVIGSQSNTSDEILVASEEPPAVTSRRTVQNTVHGLKKMMTSLKTQRPSQIARQESSLRNVVTKTSGAGVLLKDSVAKLRNILGWFFLLVGTGLIIYVSTKGGRQEKVCAKEFGACAWGRMEPKLYFKDGLLAKSTCGVGVDGNENEDGWELDVSGCELEELGGWRKAFADLEVLDLSNNELAELPGWLREEKMGKLRELRASNNKLRNFTFVDWRKSVGGVNSTALELVDLRENEIVELPYEMMDVKGEGLRLLFDGNPCAEEVDWSGLGKDRLPARMGVGYDNGGFGGNLRVLKLGRNTLDESVFEELAAANFTRIEELDVSWNALGGIGEEVRGLKKLRRLDVSGNTGVGARDLVAAPEDLEILNASFCGVDDITGEQAVELQDRNMVLHGNPVTEITWAYQNQLTKIPAWLRVLEKVKKADLGYCDIKEMKGGAFPASLEELNIQNQLVGLRLHPDSFEGLSKLRRFEASTCFLTEDDMHPGLFGDTKLERLDIMGNVDMLNFNAAALFPGSSGQQLEYLHLENCGLTGIGGESGTNFHGLLAVQQLNLNENNFGDRIAEDAFTGLGKLETLNIIEAGVFSLPARVFSSFLTLEILQLSDNLDLLLPEGIFSELCSVTSLGVNGVGSAAFTDNAFAGWPHCNFLIGEPGVREMCEAQQEVFVEGSCTDQLCETGDCSACSSEGSCGSYGWCAWQGDGNGGGSCTIPACGVGEEPNMGEGRCDACEAGKYSDSVGDGMCAMCAGGKHSETVGSATEDDCEECEAGKTSLMGAIECVAGTTIADTADHAWDFRGCIDGVPVVDAPDASGLQATLMNGASCTSEGVAFDGVDDYVDLDDWEWGGALTIESYVKYDTFHKWSRVLDFSDAGADNVILANYATSSTVAFNVVQGQQWKDLYSSNWDQSEWVHVVATASGST